MPKLRIKGARRAALTFTDLPAGVLVQIAAKLEVTRDILGLRNSCRYTRAHLSAQDWALMAARSFGVSSAPDMPDKTCAPFVLARQVVAFERSISSYGAAIAFARVITSAVSAVSSRSVSKRRL